MNELYRKNSALIKKQNRRYAHDVKRILAMLDRPFLPDSTPAGTPEAADGPGRVGATQRSAAPTRAR